jgi:hypothetical protein
MTFGSFCTLSPLPPLPPPPPPPSTTTTTTTTSLLRKFRGNWCSAMFWQLLFSYLLVLPSVFNNHNCSLTISFSARFIVNTRSCSGEKVYRPFEHIMHQFQIKYHEKPSTGKQVALCGQTYTDTVKESTSNSRFWQIFRKLTLYTFRQTGSLLDN